MPKVVKYSQRWINIKIKQLERLEPKVISKLEEVKSLQSRYDRTTSIFNLDASDISFKTAVLKAQLKSGKIGHNASFTRTFNKYLNEAIEVTQHTKRYIKHQIDIREEAYLEHFRIISEEEYEKASKMLNRMSHKMKERFFTSDKYFITPDYDSESWLKFIDDFNYSVDFAKLQDFFYQNVYHKEKGPIFRKYESFKDLNNEK